MVGTGFFSKSKVICGLKSAFLSGISCAILMFFGAIQSPAAPVESASGTIYILLGTQGTAANPSSNLSVNAIKSYIQDNIGYLNDDEYAYSAGSKIVVRPFKSSDNKELKYLE